MSIFPPYKLVKACPAFPALFDAGFWDKQPRSVGALMVDLILRRMRAHEAAEGHPPLIAWQDTDYAIVDRDRPAGRQMVLALSVATVTPPRQFFLPGNVPWPTGSMSQ
jgi:hypothetical protein